ncbi:MAG TPA: HDOD domain-containing protein [Polyangia bacterium]|jgi:CheY-like chemotaxis protein|nr:HDOD domain-containing protein [Polyangia bacterium]
MRVLIVDDDDHIRTGLQRTLGRLGYEVVVASNGEDGLKLAAEVAPAVILVDLRMPGMDGHTFARRFNNLELDASLILMSGHGEMDDVIDAIRTGAVDYLNKPWSLPDLTAAVTRGIELYEIRSAKPAQVAAPLPAPAPAPPLAPAPPPAGVELSFSSILKRVQAGDLLLPAISSVVGELRALVEQPESTLEDVVVLIERDQKMAAQLMRLANTFQYSRGVPNKDLLTAVSRVGLKRVQALAETAAANEICRIKDPALATLQAKIWTYSVARALAMRALAENASGARAIDPETAYLVGLFADVGASFLLWALAERAPVPAVPDCLTFIREHHTVVGNMIMARWGVDREITMLARLHHAATLPEPRDPYCILEVVAASLAEQLAPDGDITAKAARPGTLLRECNLSLGVSAVTQQSILARLAPELKQLLEALDQ